MGKYDVSTKPAKASPVVKLKAVRTGSEAEVELTIKLIFWDSAGIGQALVQMGAQQA